MRQVLAAALQAVEPAAAVQRHLHRDGDDLVAGDEACSLKNIHRVIVVGAGKAGVPMAGAVYQILDGFPCQGIILTKDGYQGGPDQPLPPGLQIIPAGHPLPDERGLRGAQAIAGLLLDASEVDLVICLISGGGSALLTFPAGDITLDDLRILTHELLSCGATIEEINSLRKHLEVLKGGSLARLAAPARLIALILSDVVGSPLDVIASGPTVPDPTTYADALGVLQHYQLLERTPKAILAHLYRGARGDLPETPKPGDQAFESVHNLVIGSNYQAAGAAVQHAARLGWNSLLLTTYLQGEARQAGRTLAAIARQVHASGEPLPRPACLVAGGETTVTLHGDGLGGRNQELALAAVTEMAGLPEAILVALATDGSDGPTDAAGAVVSGETLSQARRLGLDPAEYLERNDAYHFFEPIGDLLLPGPTQTNVNDLVCLFLR